MSHHKRPIKAALPQSHLFVSDGTLSHDNTILVQGEDDEPAVRPPARQMLYHPFTPQINLLVTNGAQISEKAGEPPSTDPALLDLVARMGTYQHFSNLNMADLLGVEFAQTYLRSGSLVAISLSSVTGDDLFAIDGHGTIHMRLCQSTYQTLGISGRRSKFGPRGQHFVVQIDMRDPAMRSGKGIYQRTKKSLDNFPASIFNDLVGPKFERKGRRWDVVMAWVDEQGRLQPINGTLLPSITVVETRVPEVQREEKAVCQLTKRETTDGYLDLYEQIGESILSTSETHRCSSGRVYGSTVSGRGFFHPMKLAELAQHLVRTYRMVSITGHTALSAPFSFMTTRQTHQARRAALPPRKKVKKGKSAMLGPERAVDAGPSSWTFVALDHEGPSEEKGETSRLSADLSSFPPACPDLLAEDSPADMVVRKRPRSDPATSSSLSAGRPWIMFESVGALDTHC
ncbi:hypothetical protein PCANC_10846 [Puccinia coronata f. sp. avenae]|uniref:Uncharacterized protein n=1 Tax=Puccinia coronata f. sp. avenae TaxID=200324 RepID=A0A2N5U0M6_9BASI|nr:hypothetical protein PCASD_15202 [Puccinia coronata f. sp. avenae]PLW43648.1 hypothetical protein PCANC_10846 [Puccinia coronata f. sp. avenae]